MHFSAQAQLSFEILNAFDPEKGPLVTHIKRVLKQKRFAGSKDRKAITHLCFEIIKQAPLFFEIMGLETWQHHKGRDLGLLYFALSNTYHIDDIFTGNPHCPPTLTSKEQKLLVMAKEHVPSDAAKAGLFPFLYEALKSHCDPEDFEALKQPAPLDLRCIAPREACLATLNNEGIEATTTPYSPHGIRIKDPINLGTHSMFLGGKIDIQDESSQILALLCKGLLASLFKAESCTILDLCAGAGGKALALGALMPNAKITATDISAPRLANLMPRVRQQGLKNISTKSFQDALRDKNSYDLVLVDAPCSGSGTLRRDPDLRVRLQPSHFEDFQQSQKKCLDYAKGLVKPGGHIAYATCSLAASENHTQIKKFLQRHAGFSLVNPHEICDRVLNNPLTALLEGSPLEAATLFLRPSPHETDGFFASLLLRETEKCETE